MRPAPDVSTGSGHDPSDRVIDTASRYEPSRRTRWLSLGTIALLHAAGFVALLHSHPEVVSRPRAVPLVVDLLPVDRSPPLPEKIALPTRPEITPEPQPSPQRVDVPAPVVKIPAAPAEPPTFPQVRLIAPSPPRVEEARPAPAGPADTTVDLGTRLLSADPPRYPVESRRRRESGTVALLVEVDEQGRVSSISVAETSGVERLDRAALTAVRRWRWSPTIVDGLAVRVRGVVRIPFELKAP